MLGKNIWTVQEGNYRMASPIGHALVGIGLAAIAVPIGRVSLSPALVLGAVIASGLPDLDMIAVMLGSQVERVHRRATHSLIVLVPLALAATWAAFRFEGLRHPKLVLIWSVVLLSHPFIDLVTTGPPAVYGGHGVCLFWPLTARRWYVRRPLVRPPALESYTSSEVWRRLWSEICLFGPACVTLIVLGQVL
jgi:membrane-bound metal-dependent hydrolase YbcI (DUF457 family)